MRRASVEGPGVGWSGGRGSWLGLFLLACLGAGPLLAEAEGRIEGEVRREDGSPVSGVTVTVVELGRSRVSDVRGSFRFEGLVPGSYVLRLSLGERSRDEAPVEVTAGEATRVEAVVDWAFRVAETITVTAASRRLERVVDAPAAVTVITPEQIEREASTGQLPKLLESATGVEITQSGLFDFKLNVRGVNSTVNRRVAVLIDGRNPSFPFLGVQEWAAVSFPLDDLASAELVRGPSAALYGTNAFNGVLNLVTKAPRYSQGGRARLAAGDLETARVEFRHAQALGSGRYLKVVGGYHSSEDFSRSRDRGLEYSVPCTDVLTSDCLFLEAVPLPLDRDEIAFGGLRFDKDFEGGRSLVLEGGTADVEGYAFTSSAGRFQLLDVDRPWARFELAAPRWSLLGYYTGRQADAVTLAAGTLSFADTFRASLELRRQWDFRRSRLAAGASLGREEVSTAGADGVETLISMPVDTDLQAVFAQLDHELRDDLKLVVAGRWDDSTLHDAQFSPKASLVYALRPGHTLRLSYNEAFQTPNYPEFFLRVPLAPPLALGAFEGFCAPAGVACGFDRPVPLIAVGNEELEVEKIRSLDLGYSALLGRRAFLTVDYYRTEIEDFVHVLVPQLGTALGRANPRFGPYAPPSALPAADAEALLGALEGGLGDFFPFLSNGDDGLPAFVLRATVNFGRVETQGLEVALDWALDRRWTLEANYAWLDFDVEDELAEAPLEPNGPEHKVNLGVSYVGERLSASLRYRWVEGFRWAEGVLNGLVPSYEVVNLVAGYRLSERWGLGVNVSNLFDDRHWETFSGDVMERRILAHVDVSW